MEENLAQQLAGISHGPLFQVFIDVKKTYESLDKRRLIEILRGYSHGPNLQRLLHQYCGKKKVVPKSGRFFGSPFRMERGVT